MTGQVAQILYALVREVLGEHNRTVRDREERTENKGDQAGAARPGFSSVNSVLLQICRRGAGLQFLSSLTTLASSAPW